MLTSYKAKEDILHYSADMEQLWGGMDGKILIISATISGGIHGDSVGVGEWSITPQIMAVLNSLYPDQVLVPVVSERLNDFYPENIWKDYNLILIGGPETNHVTKEAFNGDDEILKNPFVGFSIELPTYGKKEAKISSKKTIIEDWGVLVKHLSPFSKERRIYIAAGCLTYGTLAAAAILVEPRLVHETINHFGDREFKVFSNVAREENIFETRIQIVQPFRSEPILNPRAFSQLFDYICKLGQIRILKPISGLPTGHLFFICIFSFILGVCIIWSYSAICWKVLNPFVGFIGIIGSIIAITAFSLDLKKMIREYIEIQ